MAYDYKPAYNKRRNELKNIRRNLKIMGVPSSSLPPLPKNTQNPTKEIASQMRDILRQTKDIYKAERYIKHNPEISREQKVAEIEYTRSERAKKQKYYRERKAREKIVGAKGFIVESFQRRINSIPRFVSRSGRAYTGADTVQSWFDVLWSTLTTNELADLLLEAEQNGIVLEVENLYEEEQATKYVKEMINFMRQSSILDNETSDYVIEEIDYANEKGDLYL